MVLRELIDAAVNVFSNHSMTSTDDIDLMGADEVPGSSTTPFGESKQPSRTYSSAASHGNKPASATTTFVIASSTPKPADSSVPHPVPEFATPKPDKEKRKPAGDYIKEVAALKDRNEKLEQNMERVRGVAERLKAERDQSREENKALRKDFREVGRDHAAARRELSQLFEDQEQRKQLVTSLERKYEEMETLKNGSEAALAEVRQFVTTSDRSDGNFLLRKLNDLNTLIDDLAFNTSMQLADPGQPLHLDSLFKLVHYLPYQLVPMAYQAASVADPRTPTFDDIVIGFTRATLHSIITLTVWGTFCWSLGMDQDQVIGSIYRSLRDAEPQALHARWRSLTYQSLLRMKAPDDSASARAAQHYRTLLPLYDQILFLTSRRLSSQAASSCVVGIEKIVSSAFEIQKLIRQEYLSANYNVLTPPPAAPFDSDTMERVDGPDDTRSLAGGQVELVVACVGAGLTRTTQEVDGEGKKCPQTLIVKKAEVLTTRWLEKRVEDGGKMACD